MLPSANNLLNIWRVSLMISSPLFIEFDRLCDNSGKRQCGVIDNWRLVLRGTATAKVATSDTNCGIAQGETLENIKSAVLLSTLCARIDDHQVKMLGYAGIGALARLT